MRSFLSGGFALALLAAVGVGACSDAGDNTSSPQATAPAEDPAATGSLPADEGVPAAEPDPASPPPAAPVQ